MYDQLGTGVKETLWLARLPSTVVIHPVMVGPWGPFVVALTCVPLAGKVGDWCSAFADQQNDFDRACRGSAGGLVLTLVFLK